MKNTKTHIYSHNTRAMLSSFKTISMILFISLLLQNCGIIMSLLPKAEKKDNKFLLLPLALQGGARGTTNNATDTGTGTTGGTGTGTTSLPPAPIPVASVASGHYNTPQTINFSTTATGGVIRCTTNGTDPTSATPVWTPTHIWSIAGLDIKCATFVTGMTPTIQTFTYSYQPLKSGQTSCWDGAGNLISCSGTGQDGETQNGVTRSYTDNGDGTVMDNATGLLWQRCSVGQSGASCVTGSATTMTWATATGTTCTSLTTAGRTWRLPTSVELETLPNYGTINPAINTGFFPNTVSADYWSSTSNSITSIDAWFVIFNVGYLNSNNKTNNNRVRCVSGQMKSQTLSFSDNGDGTVKDKATGLIWQKCSFGQNNDGTCSGTASTMQWTLALNPCSGLTLAGKTWRLPSIKELQSLVDKNRSTSPSIDTTIFPNTVANVYWSSTPDAASCGCAWVVSFSDSIAYYSNMFNNNFVRCVSGP
ncbi:MAG: DUF1566 domain-containing protein [Leptospiraceae bacterium]|nr:DUF1566 domain-containing protein [Leptospiraceae bacterium]